mgnify:FL=1
MEKTFTSYDEHMIRERTGSSSESIKVSKRARKYLKVWAAKKDISMLALVDLILFKKKPNQKPPTNR